MRTPSLSARLVWTGVTVAVILLLAFDVAAFLTWRAKLHADLENRLAEKAAMVQAEAFRWEPEQLADHLERSGIPAVIRTADGQVHRSEPRSVSHGSAVPPEVGRSRGGAVVRTVPIFRDASATIAVDRSSTDRELRNLLAAEAAGTVLLAVLAAVLLRWISEIALRPLEQVVAAARRTTAGLPGQRLHPDRKDTRLGQMAQAYDQMLDALESALADARRAQAVSERLKAHSERILETANDAYVAMDEEGRIVEWNTQAERIFGWRRADVLGRPLVETIIPPRLRAAHLAGIERFRSTGLSQLVGRPVEMTALHRSGREFPVELTVWATRDAGSHTFNAFIRDIAQRRQAEEAQSRLAAIVESSEDAIYGKDLDGIVLTWNRGAERIYGYTSDEMVGGPISRLVPPDRVEELAWLEERIRAGQAVIHHETVRRHRDGRLIDVALTVSPIRDRDGNVVGYSTIARDITDERRMRTALDATLAELEVALLESQASEARSRRFLDDAAHQLRTPIAGVRASAEALLRRVPGDDRERLLENLLRETARASRLMTGLLRMARLNESKELSPAPCDLAALCHQEAERSMALSPGLEVEVRERLAAEHEPEVDADAVREILANLLDNARRHARQCVEVGVASENGWVEIRVSDDGPGLAEGLQERAFERFVSLDGEGGSGLGLPIVRGLAQAHGGDAYYDGAFVVRLPSSRRNVHPAETRTAPA